MIETLAFVTIVVTQPTADIPAGTQFRSTEPVRCSANIDHGIKVIELLYGKADGFCEYTYAPARSIRPKARGDQ